MKLIERVFPHNMSPIIGIIPLMNAPQAVTERYISNLIHYGRNKDFDMVEIHRIPSYHEQEIVGWFFIARIETLTKVKIELGSGATISQAVRRALIKHGVTFR